MKEIDFLPEWYSSRRRHRISCNSQFVALGLILLVLFGVKVISSHNISQVTAQTEQIRLQAEDLAQKAARYEKVKDRLNQIEQKEALIDKLDSKIDISAVLAELSFVLDESVIISKFEIKTEKKQKKPAASTAAKKQELFISDQRYKIVISGIASDVSYLATMVCELEESDYFTQVIPAYTRNKKIKIPGESAEEFEISDFEISFYLANFTKEQPR